MSKLATTATAAAGTRRRCRGMGTRSASANCATVAKRSAGADAIAFWIASSTPAGTSARRSRTLGVGSASRLTTIACRLRPVKGGSPASIS
jgi:hypothetical protein